MQRRKPASAKQRKAQLQQKRAIKRGDVSPPPPGKPDKRRKGKGKPLIHDPEAGPSGRAIAAAESSRRLQSSFVKLSAEFLEETKRLAANLPLPRAIAPEAAVWNANHDAGTKSTDPAVDKREQLTCPKRPKWRYEMSKKEVEKNEEGLFKKWLDQTDSITGDWCAPDVKQHSTEAISNDWEAASTPEPEEMPKAPTSFERNLEVWRQLYGFHLYSYTSIFLSHIRAQRFALMCDEKMDIWRVTEISQIILILLDSRCPLLHYPPSLAAFLSSPALSRKRIILVLTKVDISGPERADAWIQYLQTRYAQVRVVQVESYAEKQGTVNGKHVYEPHLPTTFRQRLVDALKETHKEMLEPPERIRDIPEKVRTWKPPVKREVRWEAVLNARGDQVGTIVGGATVPKPKALPHAGQEAQGSANVPGKEEEEELEFLTIGLIGQPNVGKSSLLNALFGTQKVRASRTPGKTKHFQTLFWTPEVRLVDCPGLVMPNLVPMETQVLAGILPISRVSAVPLCIYHAASLLPLETILSLTHPSLSEPKQQDKRTWRVPRSEVQGTSAESSLTWTAMDILTAFALKKGWMTAKAGRPDVNRAGNFILRALAEGRIKWAFWPPGTPSETISAQQTSGQGIWIRNDEGEEDEYEHDDVDSDIEERRPRSEDESDAEAEDVEDSGDEAEDLLAVSSIRSRFAALRNASGDEEESEEEGGDSTVVNTPASKFGALTVDDLEDEEDESDK